MPVVRRSLSHILLPVNLGDCVKIILADPPAPAWNTYMRAFPNLGLLYLAGHLRRELPHVDIIYLDANHSIDEHVSFVASHNPAVYGISFASPLWAVARPVLQKIREALPHVLIICGGPHPTADPEGVLASTPADVCCIGEGEECFTELVKTTLTGDDVSGVAGIAYRRADDAVVRTSHRQIIGDLDSIPLPAWDLVDLDRFSGLRQAKAFPSTAITASRGCAFNCTFCSNPIWKNATPWVRRRSPDSIAQEVELLYQRGVREVYVRSDLMNDKLDWAIQVFDALSALKHTDLYFQCNLHLARITPELASSMRRAQCWMCNVGLESGSQRVIDGIQKKFKLSGVESTLQNLKSEGIKVFAFMMLYQLWESEERLQTETTDEVFQSIRFVLSLWRRGLISQMSWAFATPYPGSDLYRVCKKYGLLPDHMDEALISSDRSTIRIPRASRFEIIVARIAGLATQALLNLTARERYQRQAVSQNMKHAHAKLHHLWLEATSDVFVKRDRFDTVKGTD